MNHRGTLPDSQWVLGLLRAKKAVSGKDSVHVQPLPSNPLRRDSGTRRAFVVWEGRRAVFHVAVGTHLAALYQVARAFSAEVPSITCKPLFFLRHEGWEILGSEYITGRRLDAAIRDGLIDTQTGTNILTTLKRSLEGTELESTPMRAAKEFQQFHEYILELEYWSDFDRIFLREIVLPFVVERVIPIAPATRWTNGDFTASNILVTDDGVGRLIDYEFAKRTHFFHDDEYRFSAFSNLPTNAPTTAPPPESPVELARRLFSLLNHALLTVAVLPPSNASHDISLLAQQILSLFGPISKKRHDQFHAASPSQVGRQLAVALPQQTKTTARVQWTLDEVWNDGDSAAVAVGTSTQISISIPAPARIRRLRLLPSDRPGVVHIAALSVRSAIDDSVILAFPHTDTRVDIGGTALPLPAEFGIRILSTGSSPFILLPLFQPEETRPLRIEVWLRVDTDLAILHQLAEGAERESSYIDGASLPGGIARVDRMIVECAASTQPLRADQQALEAKDGGAIKAVHAGEAEAFGRGGRETQEAQEEAARTLVTRNQQMEELRLQLEKAKADADALRQERDLARAAHAAHALELETAVGNTARQRDAENQRADELLRQLKAVFAKSGQQALETEAKLHQLQDAQASIVASLEEERELLKATRVELITARSEHASSRAMHAADHAASDQTIAAAHHQIELEKAQCGELTRRLNEACEAAQRAKQEAEIEIKRHQLACAQHLQALAEQAEAGRKARLAEYDSRIQHLSQEAQKQNHRVLELEALPRVSFEQEGRILELQHQLNATEGKHLEAEECARAAQKQYNELRKKESEFHAVAERWLDAVHALKAETTDLHECARLLAIERCRLENELIESTKQCDSIGAEVPALKAQCQGLENELAQLAEARRLAVESEEQIRIRLVEADAEVAASNSQIALLQESIAALALEKEQRSAADASAHDPKTTNCGLIRRLFSKSPSSQ